MSDLFSFDKESAVKSGITGVGTSGVYPVTITEAFRGKGAKGAVFMEFSFETDDGAKVNFVKLYLTNNNGEKAFGHGKFMALLGLAAVSDLAWKEVGEGDSKKQITPTLAGKKVKVGLQKKEYRNKAGEKKYTFELTHFFDAVTGCTFTEKMDNRPANTIKMAILDILLDDTQGSYSAPSVPPANDDGGLPF
jgi:hypothetical protein